MSFRGRRLALLSALLGVALVSGCGGGGGSSNGIDKLSPNGALAKVKAASAKVHSVHVKGQLNQSGQSITIDISVAEKAAEGTINIAGGTMDLRLVDGITYFRGDSKVFAAFGANGAQASLAAGRWIKASGSTGPAASFATFLDLKTLFQQLLSPQGKISSGGSATVNGKKALILVDSSSEGGKLYVATTGAALPLRIERTATNGGRIDFVDYDAGVSVSAPSGAVDLSQLTGG